MVRHFAILSGLYLLCILSFVPLSIQGVSEESFDESLLIQPLRFGHVAFSFNFTLTRSLPPYTSAPKKKVQYFNLFPRSLGQILHDARVHTLDLSFTQGRWLSEVWGSTPWTHWEEFAPPGMELRAWLVPHLHTTPRSMHDQWNNFTHALAGLFCASIHTVRESSITTHPKHTFADRTPHFFPVQFFHASLAREAVCTENLTPWVKLLPGHTSSGLSATLDAYRLFDSNFNSIQTHVDLQCDASLNCKQILRMNLITVFDVSRSLSQLHPGPGFASWSYSKLIGKAIGGKCPLARTSQLLVAIPSISNTVSPKPHTLQKSEKGDWSLAMYTLKENVPLDLTIDFERSSMESLPAPETWFPFNTYRYITGSALDEGVLHLYFQNLANHAQSILYYDTFPWIFPRYLHTLKCTCGPIHLSPHHLLFQHALDRVQPSVMEIVYEIPAKTECRMSIQFSRSMMHFSEYPPDTSRGFEISAGIVTFLKNVTDIPSASESSVTSQQRPRIYLNLLQTQLPAPDFSMPYNVITFTSTVVVLYFSGVFALTTRRFYRFSLNEKGEPVIQEEPDHKKKE